MELTTLLLIIGIDVLLLIIMSLSIINHYKEEFIEMGKPIPAIGIIVDILAVGSVLLISSTITYLILE